MERVPQELTKMIMDDLLGSTDHTFQDLRNLRLVSKQMAQIATPPLFRNVAVWISVDSLQRFTNISEHSQLSQYVEKIIFSPLRLLSRKDTKEYEARVRSRLELSPVSMNNFQLTLTKHMCGYKGLIMAQQKLCEDGQHSKMITRALRGFRRELSIHIDFRNCKIGAADVLGALGFALDGSEFSLNGEHTLPAFIKALKDASVRVSKFKLGRSSEDASQEHVSMERDSLTDPFSKQNLTVNYRERDLNPTAIKATFLENDRSWRSMFAKTSALCFGDIHGDKTPLDVRQTADIVGSIIQAASKMQIFELGSIGSDALGHPSAVQLLRTCWECSLRSVEIYNTYGTVFELYSVFSRFAKTLQYVRLNLVKVIGSGLVKVIGSGSWMDILNRLRKNK